MANFWKLRHSPVFNYTVYIHTYDLHLMSPSLFLISFFLFLSFLICFRNNKMLLTLADAMRRAMLKWYSMYVSECMTQNHFPRIYLRQWNDCGRILVFKNASHEATNINLMIPLNSEYNHHIYICVNIFTRFYFISLKLYIYSLQFLYLFLFKKKHILVFIYTQFKLILFQVFGTKLINYRIGTLVLSIFFLFTIS